MKKFLASAAVAITLAAFLAPAEAQQYVNRNELAAGALGGANAPLNVMPMGIVYEILAPVTGTTGTSEETLATFSLPAGSLDVVGRHLRVTAMFKHAANTNAITPKLYFGSEALATAADSGSGDADRIACDIVKTGASTQQVNCWGLGGAAGVVPVTVSAAGAETDTSAIVIKGTCTGGTTGADCTLSDFLVEILN
jgi:hypothetical protein